MTTAWCCITPERKDKTLRIMNALSRGIPGARTCHGAPLTNGRFFVWGQMYLAEEVIPDAVEDDRPWWQIDNGYHKPACGGITGYYSFNYRQLGPVMLEEPDMDRCRIKMKPWRDYPNGDILIALPGMSYGKVIGMDMREWSKTIAARVREHTNKRIIIREKTSRVPLEDDLLNAQLVITHSSKVAVEAVIRGIPCVVEPTNPAAPVCSTSLDDISCPKMPDRDHWWQSLMCQQFTIDEMKSGLAWHWLQKVEAQHHVG